MSVVREKSVRWLLPLLVILGLSACPYSSEHPLSDPGAAALDSALVGSWKSQDPETLDAIYTLARQVKEHIYGRRIVMFAPLYLSDFCVNRCSYCGYNCENKITRRRLTQVLRRWHQCFL